MDRFEKLIIALKEIARLAEKIGATIWYPGFIKQDEADIEGYQKQSCESELFKYELCSQSGPGISGDDFRGEMMYPFEDWFIQVHYEC